MDDETFKKAEELKKRKKRLTPLQRHAIKQNDKTITERHLVKTQEDLAARYDAARAKTQEKLDSHVKAKQKNASKIRTVPRPSPESVEEFIRRGGKVTKVPAANAAVMDPPQYTQKPWSHRPLGAGERPDLAAGARVRRGPNTQRSSGPSTAAQQGGFAPHDLKPAKPIKFEQTKYSPAEKARITRRARETQQQNIFKGGGKRGQTIHDVPIKFEQVKPPNKFDTVGQALEGKALARKAFRMLLTKGKVK